MGLESEVLIDAYYGTYKEGIFGKPQSIELLVYPSYIEGEAFGFYDGQLSNNVGPFHIPYQDIKKIYIGEIKHTANITIEYGKDSVVNRSSIEIVALMDIKEPQKWLQLICRTKEECLNKLSEKERLDNEKKEAQRRFEIQREESAVSFYQKCYTHYIKEETPVYSFFTDQNKGVMLFVDENKGLNFLKIDGYAEEENRGIITYNNIHYYEKAGNIHYTTDIHGKYSSYGGSITGGNFSKLAAIGGGLLFGMMGMATGAVLTHKPVRQEPVETNFTIDSEVRKIDDRNVILNFYSESKKQYVDIELPYEIYNFLSTYIPEKKYAIVDEMEKRTAIHQSAQIIESGDLLKVPARGDAQKIETQKENDESLFVQKINKLKMLKEAGLLSDEEFDSKRKELLDMI